MDAAQILQRTFLRFGAHIERARPASARRAKLIEDLNIDAVLDVGANTGQYGSGLRNAGFQGRIISFEPLSGAFAELTRAAAADRLWDVHNIALSDSERQGQIHVAKNLVSSSLLEVLPEHLAAAPDSATVGVQDVELRRLNSVVPAGALDSPILLKLDVQGHELAVISGATSTLKDVVLVECEMSIVALYRNQPLLRETVNLFSSIGFELIQLERGWYDVRDGRTLQVDGYFARPQPD